MAQLSVSTEAPRAVVNDRRCCCPVIHERPWRQKPFGGWQVYRDLLLEDGARNLLLDPHPDGPAIRWGGDERGQHPTRRDAKARPKVRQRPDLLLGDRAKSFGDEQKNGDPRPQPRRAASIAATSIFIIVIIASKARFASLPPAAIASVSVRGVICHDTPHLSLH